MHREHFAADGLHSQRPILHNEHFVGAHLMNGPALVHGVHEHSLANELHDSHNSQKINGSRCENRKTK